MTLVPESLSVQQVIKNFYVAECMVKQASALKKEQDVLTEPKLKSGRALSKDIVDCVIKLSLWWSVFKSACFIRGMFNCKGWVKKGNVP